MEAALTKRSISDIPLFVRDLGAAAVLAILSLLISLGVNALRNDSLPLLPEAPERTLVRGLGPIASKSKAPPPHIGLDEAVAAYDAQNVIFIDAREKAFYRLERIQGAWSLPRGDFKTAYAAFSEEFREDRPLVIYCSSEDCADSDVVARALVLLGYQHVSVYKGGFEEWQAAGLPTESGL